MVEKRIPSKNNITSYLLKKVPFRSLVYAELRRKHNKIKNYPNIAWNTTVSNYRTGVDDGTFKDKAISWDFNMWIIHDAIATRFSSDKGS